MYLRSPGVMLSCSCILAAISMLSGPQKSHIPELPLQGLSLLRLIPRVEGLYVEEGSKMNKDMERSSTLVSYSCHPSNQSSDMIHLMN